MIQRRAANSNANSRASARKNLHLKKLRREVSQAIGAGKKSSVASVERIFQPHFDANYPLRQMFHDFSKLPRETVENFVSIQKLSQQIKSNPAVSRLLQKHPFLEQQFESVLRDAIRDRGIRSSKFWERAPKEYIDQIISTARGNPNPMNERLARIAKNLFGKQVVERTIVDIGTFAGGTISEVVKTLSSSQRRMLNLVLVDVNERVVREYAVPLLVSLGVPRERITVVPSSFYNAAVAYGHMRRPLSEKGSRHFERLFNSLREKVDLITAGASTLNFANDLNPLLKSVKTMLKPGGAFLDWEWGSNEARMPNLNVREMKNKVIGLNPDTRMQVTEFDAYTSFIAGFWLPFFKYPESVSSRFLADVERSAQQGVQFNFFDWVEQNVELMEKERVAAGDKKLPDPAGFRNRAYRDGNAMHSAALKIRLIPSAPIYPLAEPGKITTGNVNWLVEIRKNN